MSQRTGTTEDRGAREAGAVGEPGVVVLFSEAAVPGDGVYPGRRELSIGRDPSCGVFIDDGGMSSHHATLEMRDGQLLVTDVGGRDGTRVNGTPIGGPTPLGHGDVLRCGKTVLLCHEDVSQFEAWRRRSGGLLVGGPRIQQLLAELLAFGRTSLGVLVIGESGTGKELAARTLHEASGRRGAFVPINCAAIAEKRFEAELFGVARGALPGAEHHRPGAFRQANKGTLFLDEIGELPASQQAKLLRAVEQKESLPLGGSQPLKADVRVVAATDRCLRREVQAGRFRPDLYHRLRGGTVEMLPLRACREDIALLVERRLSGASGYEPWAAQATLCASFVEALLLYDWPGNVRELNGALDDAFVRARAEACDRLLLRHLRPEIVERSRRADQFAALKEALIRYQGNVSRVAVEFGMHRARVYTLLLQNGIAAEDFR